MPPARGPRPGTAAGALAPGVPARGERQRRSSPEALASRLLAGRIAATPLALVDLANANSVRNLVPVGAHDLERLPPGEIELRYARPESDRLTPLGGRAADFDLRERMPVYAVGDEVLCWCWNHRDSRATCLTPSTDRALFVVECIDFGQKEAAERALDELRGELRAAGTIVGPGVWTAGASQLRIRRCT